MKGAAAGDHLAAKTQVEQKNSEPNPVKASEKC